MLVHMLFYLNQKSHVEIGGKNTCVFLILFLHSYLHNSMKILYTISNFWIQCLILKNIYNLNLIKVKDVWICVHYILLILYYKNVHNSTVKWAEGKEGRGLTGFCRIIFLVFSIFHIQKCVQEIIGLKLIIRNIFNVTKL